MNMVTKINRPRRIYATCESQTPAGAVFIGPKSEWYPKGTVHDSTPAHDRELYRQMINAPRHWRKRIAIRNELRGKDIASACPPEQESFVDVLIDVANSDEIA
ncbi:MULTISPECIES: DUF4326 domain-containing protein [Pacificibacter]|uniref:DUF4326 domain-containing protein n=1 Tax=Pacificibacter TaxID=1042323 RepID=UPI001C081CB8|nr:MULTISPECIES: DUF4326 domain-containing protein [Pacificibacter]MBU2937001.1 DUF4326 domain-containing protein [Pacificibacter marinus]MDO6617177.1 DUF4326 domain-containing protein [Pacificibacter sp. 1_MG-2023]